MATGSVFKFVMKCQFRTKAAGKHTLSLLLFCSVLAVIGVRAVLSQIMFI